MCHVPFAWYIVVLSAKWCFYSEFPVECYNGIIVMTARMLLKGIPDENR